MLLTSGASAQAPAQAGEGGYQATLQAAYDESSLKNAIRLDDGRIAVIVQLADPPVATYAGGKPGLKATSPQAAGQAPQGGAGATPQGGAGATPQGGAGAIKLDAASPASLAYTSYLEGVQAQFINALASAAPSATVDYTYQTAFNGLALKLQPGETAAVARLPGVTAIYPDQLRTVQMDASLSLIKAQAEWTRLGFPSGGGQGIKIADVDTGLDSNNPMFSGAGFSLPAGYPKGECPALLSFQCNNKVIAGRHFYTAAAVLAGGSHLELSEQQSPFGVVSHGTHTAGTAAGDALTANVNGIDFNLSGVAPAAYLMVYKALWGIVTSGNVHTGSGADSDLVAALNAALADGADVINNSWGGGAGGDPNASLYKPVIAAITAAGTLVVFSAGNSGPGGSTIGCPGCVADALTVAASTTNRIVANTLNITGPGTVPPALTAIGAVNSDKPLLAPISGPIRYNASDVDGCTAFPGGFFSGAAALIGRGNCNFNVKVINAAAAGATAVIVFNNVSGPPGSMSGINGLSIPALMVDQAAGQAIRDWILANPSTAAVAVTQAAGRVTNNAYQDIMAGFSSVGPDGDPNVLKPDITAPGVNILSASSPVLITGASEPWYEFLQGTSMAAPHVTGAAALLKQQHPTWTPLQIKSALTTSAVQTLKLPDGVTPAYPFNMGSGRLDLDRAGQVGLTFDRTSFASGNCVNACSWTVALTNVSGGPVTYNASSTAANPLLKLLVSPSSFSIAAGASTSFTVTATVSAISDLTSWNFGSVVWKDQAGVLPDATFPLAVRPGTATNPLALSESVNKATSPNGGELAYTISLANPYPNPATFSVQSGLPNSLVYKDGTATGGLVYDANTRMLSASLPLAAAQMDVLPTGQATQYVAGAVGPGVTNLTGMCPITDPVCDETVATLTGLDFWYMGVHYTSATISSNGFFIPGTVTTIPAFSSFNASLPSPFSPTNLIAPLWSDLEFAKAGAKWLVWGNATYTVIEWQNADQYASSLGLLYSFEIWIKKGTSEITFAYGALSSDVANPASTHGYTVGIENLDGSYGKTHFYRPYGGGAASGSAPVVATDLKTLNAMTVVSLGFSGYAAVPSAAVALINNGVKATNNLNPDVQQAAALTAITTFPVARIPYVSK